MSQTMNCDAIDAGLSDYLEGTLDPAQRRGADAHISSCARCTALVRDLAKITAEARLLPELVPSRDLWQGIDARIAAPVIPLAAMPHAPRKLHTRRLSPAWLGLAASALMMSTAGVTYFLTARTLTPAGVAVVPARPDAARAQPAVVAGLPESEPTPGGEPSGVRRVEEAPPRNAGGAPARIPSGSGPARAGTVAAFVSQTPEVRDPQTDVVFGREIEMLQQIVLSRRSQLDSSTVAIIERNLKVIDAAIEQSRAALARDPASSQISDQLTRVLDKKVELLRTAALLPAST